MSFWADYVLLKEQAGVARSITLAQIAQKYGQQKREEIEQELALKEA